jgi:hypothetical protein
MVDPQDPDLARYRVDLVDDPIRSASCRPEPFELALELVSDPTGIPRQGPAEELDHRGRGLLGEAGERAVHRGSHDQLPGTRAHRSG